MKNTFFFLLVALIIASCNNERSICHLLDQPGKWNGDAQFIRGDGVVFLEGEYNTWVFQPGILKTFENFELTTEVFTRPGANASILFHTNERDLSHRRLKQGPDLRLQRVAFTWTDPAIPPS